MGASHARRSDNRYIHVCQFDSPLVTGKEDVCGFDVPVQYIYRIISQGCHFYVETWGVTHPKAALVVKWYNFRLWLSRVITATVSLSQAQAIGFDPQRRTSALGIMSIDYSLLKQQELFAIRGRFGFDSRRALTFTYPSFCFLCSNTLPQLRYFT